MKFSVAVLPPSLWFFVTIAILLPLRHSKDKNYIAVEAASIDIKQDHPFDELEKFKKIKTVIDKVYNNNIYDNERGNEFQHRHIEMHDGTDIDPCSHLPTFVDGYADVLFRPSALSACAGRILIKGDSMLLHLGSMKTIFRQYHCFHDIAKDPENSIPASIQPEMGNTIYGVGGGQVDLEAGLTALEDEVISNGFGTMKMFWQIQSLFHLLYDGHVVLPTVANSFNYTCAYLVPERFVGATAGQYVILQRLALEDVADGTGGTVSRLGMTLTFSSLFGKEEKNVLSIDGLSVHDWFINFANNPNILIYRQQLGARINYLADRGYPFSTAGVPNIGGDPAGLFPDSFVVTYNDGTSETFHSGFMGEFQAYVSPSFGVFGDYSLNRVAAQEDFNVPGAQFDAYARAMGLVNKALSEGNKNPTRSLAKQKHVREIQNKVAAKSETTQMMEAVSKEQNGDGRNLLSYDFDFDYTSGEGGRAGIKVQDDYVVFKFDSFSIPENDMIDIWSKVVQVGEEAGVKKVLIDMSNNRGGLVVTGYVLLFLMFPFADMQWFTDQWDINYNDSMRLFADAFLTTVFIMFQDIENRTNSEFQDRIDGYTSGELTVFQIASDAMAEICHRAAKSKHGNPSYIECEQVYYLQANATKFVHDPNLDTYLDFFKSLLDTTVEYNPWSVVLEIVENTDPNITETLVKAGVFTNIRGGVSSNVTDKFDLIGTPVMKSLKDRIDGLLSTSLNYFFDEFVIVSNGLSGSMGAMIPLIASSMYKNRDRSLITSKVTLVSYGGTGVAEDLSISSFPASAQGVHLDDPIICDAALRMLINLLPMNLTGLDLAIESSMGFAESIAPPPFFGDSLPHMPVVNLYDKFMEPGALPLQYVKYPVDEYIPTTYSATTFTHSTDLADLYTNVAMFFTTP